MKKLWIVVGIFLVLVTGCANTTAPQNPGVPTSAAVPSNTSAATSAPQPSNTAAPTNTAIAANTTAPTSAPQATNTIAPTAVPPTSAPRARATDTTSSTSNASDWTMYHFDQPRTGYVANMPDPQKLTVAWNTQLDGAVYAEPLVVSGHVIVATENDTVYSLNPQTGQIEWHTNLGTPVSRGDLPCGDIDPLGITGTPIYDPATGLIFAVAEMTGPAHTLFGLDARTGAVKLHRSADTSGMELVAHQQRGALALAGGMVYIAYGGLFGDCGNYQGRVVASRTDGSGPLLQYQVPTSREGGIWTPPGPVIDSSGNLFVSVGNGAEVVGDWDHTDSVLRLSPALQLQDGFAPDQWRQDNLTDADLGSLGPVLLPGGFVFIAGKAGIGYVLHANSLGGVGGQVQAQSLCHAYGGAAVVGSTAFIPCNEGVQQIQVGLDGSLKVGWSASGVPGSPVVGGHTVYSLDRGGTLHALDINTGKDRATVDVGNVTRFATPTLFGNRVFIGTLNSIVAVTVQ